MDCFDRVPCALVSIGFGHWRYIEGKWSWVIYFPQLVGHLSWLSLVTKRYSSCEGVLSISSLLQT